MKLDFVDDFTMAMVRNLCVEDTTFKKALYQTADEKVVDPTYRSVFSYYPSEDENHTLVDIK